MSDITPSSDRLAKVLAEALPVDVVIFGGGVAGLWMLDELVRQGYSTLLIESTALGSGQTIASQGIIHGGLKYTLAGALTSSAQMIRQMPLIWRECLAGTRLPDLSGVQMRSDHCHLWRTESWRSQFGMVGARVGLNVKPTKLDKRDWPAALAQCPGGVFQLDEQVLRPTSLVEELARPHQDRLLLAEPEQITFDLHAPGDVAVIHLHNTIVGRSVLSLAPRQVLLMAGAGNAAIRKKIGLDPQAMQRRPLHMVMARSNGLPPLNGHCVDGSRTRITITTDHDSQGRTIWQVGGQISEDGVKMEAQALARHALEEVRICLPGVDLSDVAWSTYRVDRAEATTDHGRRPDDIHLSRHGNTFTTWPTKLALAPRLADHVITQLDKPFHRLPALPDWPRPAVALPPWEVDQPWWETAALSTTSG